MFGVHSLQLTALALVVSGALAAGGGGGGSGGGNGDSIMADLKNIDMSKWLSWIWVSIIFVFILYQIIFHLIRYIRTIACLNNEHQRYFHAPSILCGRFKKYLLDAPLFRKRHHREFRLSAAINVGTLPSRLEMLFLTAYFAVNAAFCVVAIDWSGQTKSVASEFRGRTGVLAVVNMVPLFLMSTRNNPFITFCGISFDTFNLLHRWFGRIVVLEAIAHTVAYLVNKVQSSGWTAVQSSISSSQFISSGLIGTVAFVALSLLSPSILRHAFYETFLHIHIVLAALALGAVWVHLKGRAQQVILYVVLTIWVAERALRLISLVYRSIGSGGTKAVVEVLPGDALRVNIKPSRAWHFRPGQHVYLYIPSVGWWTAHPFSLAWSAEEEDLSAEKGLPLDRKDVLANSRTTMSVIIRRRTGFTDKLYRKAEAAPAGKMTLTAMVEGPYGGESLTSYGTVMLFAAGIGITHQVPHVRDTVARFANATTATRRLTLVWIIQSPEHLEWIRPWMTSILSMPNRREVLKIMLFVTRPRSTKEIHSPSASVQMFPGKPNVDALIEAEMVERVGAACVSVCGTGSLADDVRRAVRVRESKWNVDFREEAFSW